MVHGSKGLNSLTALAKHRHDLLRRKTDVDAFDIQGRTAKVPILDLDLLKLPSRGLFAARGHSTPSTPQAPQTRTAFFERQVSERSILPRQLGGQLRQALATLGRRGLRFRFVVLWNEHDQLHEPGANRFGKLDCRAATLRDDDMHSLLFISQLSSLKLP